MYLPLFTSCPKCQCAYSTGDNRFTVYFNITDGEWRAYCESCYETIWRISADMVIKESPLNEFDEVFA